MRTLISRVLFGLALAIALVPSVSFADEPKKCTNAFNCALGQLETFASGSGVNTKQTPETIAGNIINTGIGILGVVAVALVVYAGGLWITAAGNDDKVEKAKSIIKTTVIGMVVVGLAYAITLFIASFVTG